MMNKSATKACAIKWSNGNETVLWLGYNSNTGNTIVWQVVWRDGKPGKSMRITGGNIAKLAAEIDAAMLGWECCYTFRNEQAMKVFSACDVSCLRGCNRNQLLKGSNQCLYSM